MEFNIMNIIFGDFKVVSITSEAFIIDMDDIATLLKITFRQFYALPWAWER